MGDKNIKCLNKKQYSIFNIVKKIFLPIIGFLSFLWIVYRVISKPSRIQYPCIRMSAPVASGFLIWIMGLFSSAYAIHQIKRFVKSRRWILSVTLMFVVLILTVIFTYDPQLPVYANSNSYLAPNTPVGTPRGVKPGRVVWSWNPKATNENCTNAFGDAYYLSQNTNIDVVNSMIDESILRLTGAENLKCAWDSLFVYFNRNHAKVNHTYNPGEKICIKTNAVGTSVDEDYNVTNLSQYQMARTSPQPVLVILRHLINICGIAQENISVGDPSRYMQNEVFDLLHGEFPDVKYICRQGTKGRTKSVATDNASLFYSDRGTILRTGSWEDASSGSAVHNDKLFTVIENADYLINISAFKAHERAGVTFCAKNHFGSQGRSNSRHMHMGLVSPDQGEAERSGYGLYRIQVDLMAHKDLGGKTVLFMVDGLWGGSGANDPPRKFQMMPFNNDWSSSIFMSQDQVALESVCYDFLKAEFTEDNPYGSWPQMVGTDDYLMQAADNQYWPEGFVYDPEKDETAVTSLGVHEHWNNDIDKQYTGNLEGSGGIELVKIENTTSVESEEKSLPDDIQLLQNYPNPFNAKTVISFYLEKPSQVSLKIYDIQGHQIETVCSGIQPAGFSRIHFSGSQYASGVYFYELLTEYSILRRKMVLIR